MGRLLQLVIQLFHAKTEAPSLRRIKLGRYQGAMSAFGTKRTWQASWNFLIQLNAEDF